jgi:hypothetical protein
MSAVMVSIFCARAMSSKILARKQVLDDGLFQLRLRIRLKRPGSFSSGWKRLQGCAMRLIELYTMRWRLRLARYVLRASMCLALLGKQFHGL